MAAWRSTTEWKTPRLRRRFDSLAKKPSTALSQEAQVEAFVNHYNHQRYHESLRNLTPADVYFGRGQTTPLDRERIKRQTIQQRRLIHQQHAA